MTLISFRRVLLTVGLVGIFVAATLIVARPQEPLRVIQTGSAEERYFVHVSTDKPIYRTGEKVYVRGVFLHVTGHTPMTGTGAASFEIKSPRGETVSSGLVSFADSVLGFAWDIPSTQTGGEYTVRIFNRSSAPAERKFDIRSYRPPRLKSQIVFLRDGYGPGDTVSATLHVERAEGGVPIGAKVSVSARVDGAEAWTGETLLDGSGNAGATFKLPASIAHGDGVLAMVVQDGGAIETATKTIPILLHTLDLAIYPEGGDLVAGLTNRVYVEGRTPAQKPADMAGVIVNAEGKQVASFRTEHEGRGRFTFTPIKDEKYSLKVTEPAGIQTAFPLPAVKASGVVISSISDITKRQEEIGLRVASTVAGNYGIALAQRGREISFKRISLRSRQSETVSFAIPRSLDGVIVATVYDDRNAPVAERLLFRESDSNLKVQIRPDRTDYVPGDKVTLRITTTDQAGKPVGAVVGLTVSDSSVLEMIEKREQSPRLPVMVFLEHEVQNLADAHVYLDTNNPKAPLATDLLLGTQGWRRFLNAGTGTLDGTIIDSSGAVLPGVVVQALNLETGATTETNTNERGHYAFSELRAGTYQLSTALPGFKTETSNDLRIPFKSSLRQDLQLQVAGNLQMAMVQAAAAPNAFAGFGGAVRKVFPAMAPAPPAAPPNAQAPINAKIADQKLDLVRQQGARELNALRDRADFARREVAANIPEIREYAHALRPNWTEGSRIDFAETVYWNAGIKTDSSTGTASVSFSLSDSVTSFNVFADGFTSNGSLGSSTGHIEAVQPFSIEPKLPLQVTSGDVIQLPISVINGTNHDLRAVGISAQDVKGLQIGDVGNPAFNLTGKERGRHFLRIDVGDYSGLANLTFDGKAGRYLDTVTRKLDVQPAGFPHETSMGGVLDRNGSQSFELRIPNEVIAGSMSATATAYPTPLASMTDALQSLLRQPFGCFEQTSSTSYPMVMAQQYFRTHTGVDPAIIEKTKDLLEVSYKRLVGFETRTKGYEWFGADPGHEALTAYGLMQFTDMAQVRTVDKEMLDRTRAWLLSRRDGSGGFLLNPKALDTFGGAPVGTTNAYIVWALVESGEKGLSKEIQAIKTSADSTQDSYVVALAANILHATGDSSGARQLMDRLAAHQDASGGVKGAVTSITRSGGDALAIETTSLSVLAWMREPAYAAQSAKGLKWIAEMNKSGRFGSTQSTILALRAIVGYDAAHARPKAPGQIALVVDGKPFDVPLAFTPNTQGSLALPDFASKLGPGKHTVSLKMENGSSMPFAISVKYHSTLPESSEHAQVGIQVSLTDSQIQEGAVTEAIVSIANKSDETIPTPVAVVGIPGGLEVRHDQLKELVRSGKIDAYEVNGREVVLYWRYLKAKNSFDIPLSLVAAVPGSYFGPASRAYLYYTDEYKNWTPGLRVTISPK